MIAAMGAVLPYAIGIAISPVPIAATILMLLGPRAPRTAVGFAVGWVLGIVASVTLLTWLVQLLPAPDGDQPLPVVAIIQFVVAGGLLVLVVRNWRDRGGTSGEEPEPPSWMKAIDRTTPLAAVGLGLLLAAANPKNLLLAASSASAVGAGEALFAGLVVHSLLASSTVLATVGFFLIARERATEPLRRLRAWLTQHNAAIMSGVLLVLAASMVGKALGNL